MTGTSRADSGNTRVVARLACSLLVLFLAACAPTTRLPEADALSARTGYRPSNLSRVPGNEAALPRHYVVLAFSGGGTRATALAHGVLRELEATPAPPPAPSGLTLLDAVDLISSASGGSVAAANYVVNGRENYRRIDAPSGFLHHDGLSELIVGVIANAPVYAATDASRIQLLSTMLKRTVVGNATYGDLAAASATKRPYLVLNATDMLSGERFPFTQDQLDLLCLDLRQVKVADAVTASAAFPVALTPLPLPDRSPCKAQRDDPDTNDGGRALIESVVRATGHNGFDGLQRDCGGFERNPLNTGILPLRSRARRQYAMLNRDKCGNELPDGDPRRVLSVHLLDGGVADNVGLSGPLETLTGRGDDPRVAPALRRGQVTKAVVIAVNARSQPDSSIGRDGRTPGIVSMARTTIGAAIDGRSGGLQAELFVLPELVETRYNANNPALRVIPIAVEFEMIEDPDCRAAFQNVATSWTLSAREVDALQELGSALLRASPAYLELAGVPAGPARDAALQVGQARGRSACSRLLRRPDAPTTAPVFGPAPMDIVTSRPASSRG